MSGECFLGFYGNTAPKFKNIAEKCLSEFLSDFNLFFKDNAFLIYSKDIEKVENFDLNLELNIGNGIKGQSETNLQIAIKEELSLKRDYWGIKNIYYTFCDDGIIFASDIKLMLSSGILINFEYDTDSLEEMASFGYILREDATIFREIKQVKRNSVLKVTKKGKISFTERYKTKKINFKNFNDFCDKLLYSMKEVISDTLASDERLKIFFLSGGIDSALISILASKYQKINTVTFVSTDNLEDVFYANTVSKAISSKHKEIPFPNDAIKYLPEYLRTIEGLELNGIFSPLGGFANYLLIKLLESLPGAEFITGDGADELFAGYYWQFTHPYGFADKLKSLTKCNLFPLPEEKAIYRKIIREFLAGSALTNGHLNNIGREARSFNMNFVPIYTDKRISDLACSAPLSWLCNDRETKIPIKNILSRYLETYKSSDLLSRKKLAMPSVVPSVMSESLLKMTLSYENHSHPYGEYLKFSPFNCMMFDIFHKYFTLNPRKNINTDEWEEDVERMTKFNEPIVYR